MSSAVKVSKPSAKAKALASRLLAVQALYQNILNKRSLDELVPEYLDLRSGMDLEGELLVEANSSLFEQILRGASVNRAALEEEIKAHYAKGSARKTLEPLLMSILLCASYEICESVDIDSPILINDYLNVAHAFYEKNEVGLLNGILDSLAAMRKNS